MRPYYALFNSGTTEVTMFLAWVLAHTGCTKGNTAFPMLDFVPYAKMLAYDENERVRELACIAVSFLENTDFKAGIDTWVDCLPYEEKTLHHIKTELKAKNIDMPLLVHPKLEIAEIRLILSDLKLPIGIQYKLILKLKELREELTEIRNQVMQVVNKTTGYLYAFTKDEIQATSMSSEEKYYTELINGESVSSPKLEQKLITKSAIVSESKPEINGLEHHKHEKHDIFISYSWADKAVVHKIVGLLEKQGLSCWIDVGEMIGGDQLFAEMDKGITSSRIFIACCSNQYTSSINCQRELMLAADRKKLIIPTWVGEIDVWPPTGQMAPLLAGKLYIDISTEEKLDETLQNLIVTLKQSV